jgi:Protein of unknown function (DUF3293)
LGNLLEKNANHQGSVLVEIMGKRAVPLATDPHHDPQHLTRLDHPGQPSYLEQAYRGTSYEVDTPDGRLVLRIGLIHPALDQLLLRHGCRTWAYVTAHNPASNLLQPEKNQCRQRDLEEEVSKSGRPFFRGEGVGTDGNWPAEQSLLILSISLQEALDLAERHGQAALVFGEIGQTAQLLWTALLRPRDTP